MIDQIDKLVNTPSHYMYQSKHARQVAENRFLEKDKNIDRYLELYTYPIGSEKRVNLKRYNT